MKIYCAASLSIAAAAVLVSGSCNRQRAPTANERKSPVEDIPLDGQVFIVTRGAENVRLGELYVHLVQRRLFDELHLLESAPKEQEQIRRAFDAAKKAGNAGTISGRCSGGGRIERRFVIERRGESQVG
jgi:hypothetical protein